MTAREHEDLREDAARPPSSIGRYRVLSCLGRGGMAEVFLAMAQGAGGVERLVVVKRLRSDLVDEGSFRSMLVDEARVAARLHHENVVHTYDVGEDDTGLFLVMEYLEGQPLSRLQKEAQERDEPLGDAVSAFIAHEALAGLHHAHTLEDFDGTPLCIVHRDVSPHNVLVTYDGRVKVVDFGIAKAILSATVTEVGVLKGKAAYMAPECILGETADARADVFTVGIVLWELLAGRRLYAGLAPSTTIHRILNDEAPSLAAHAPAVDESLAAVVARALHKDPDLRFTSAHAMQEAIAKPFGGSWADARASLEARMRRWFEEDRHRMRELVKSRGSLAPGAPVSDWPDSGPPSHDAVTRAAPRGAVLTPLPASTATSTRAPTTTALSPGGLRLLEGPRGAKRPLPGLALLVGIALAVVALVFVGRIGRVHVPVVGAIAQGPPAPAATARTLLRLHGSNTVGAALAPALAEAFLHHEGFESPSHEGGPTPQVTRITARDRAATVAIEVRAEGSATAFEDLAARRCDIGLASRPPREDERQAMANAGIGDVTRPASEHILALDGIAVIVHPNRDLHHLDLPTLRRVFVGDVRAWDGVAPAGPFGPIAVYGRDDASGTFDTFRHLVLAGAPLAPEARRFASSEDLADAVAGDIGAIGFVSLAHVGSARAIAVAEPGMRPTFPTTFTVATESYPLTRRLYLYTPATPASDWAARFVRFALSREGQAIVRDLGFVDLDIKARAAAPCEATCPKAYARIASHAQRLSLDFRFRPGASDLDSRAVRDIDRVVAFLATRPSPRVVLIGFADGVGDRQTNAALARDRARRVGDELAAHGIPPVAIESLGDEMPVAAGTSPEARAKNRRVEVWLEDPGP